MPFPFKFRRDKVVVESEGWRKSVSRSFVKVGGGGSGERSSAGGWRCWFAKKEKKRDGGGGGGGGCCLVICLTLQTTQWPSLIKLF